VRIGSPTDTNVDTMSRRCWPVSVAVIAAVALSACHYNPYRYPHPGDPGATTLENQLNQRDSLQDAAKDMIAVAAAMRDAVQRVFPDAQWTPTSDGTQANCGPPFVFLTGTVYVLPRWESRAPTVPHDAEVVIAAAADALKAHHADKVDPKQGQSVSGVLPREHGELQVIISPPANFQKVPPTLSLTGTTGCHHPKPGAGPWDTPARVAPTPGNVPESPAPPAGNAPESLVPPPGNAPESLGPPPGNAPGAQAPPR
jgi:predicted LppA-like lipoprotein